jgi:hypothetical protein
MQMFTLRKLRAAVPFLACFQRLQRKYMRAAIRIFGTADMGPRVQALLFARHMAATLPPPATELAIKAGPLASGLCGTPLFGTCDCYIFLQLVRHCVKVHLTSASNSMRDLALVMEPAWLAIAADGWCMHACGRARTARLCATPSS